MKYSLFFFLFFHPICSMQKIAAPTMPQANGIPSLQQLCVKLLAKYYADIDEITPEVAELIALFENELSHCRGDLVDELINQSHIPVETNAIPLCTVPANGKFSPDGSKLLIPYQKSLHIHDAQTGAFIHSLTNPSHSKALWLEKAIWSPKGGYIFCQETPSFQYYKHVWQSNTGEFLYSILFESADHFKCSADKNLIFKKYNNNWQIYDMQTGNIRGSLGAPSSQLKLWAQDPLGEWIIINSDSKQWQSVFHDAQKLEELKTIPGYVQCFNQDGSLMIVVNDENRTFDFYDRSFTLIHKINQKLLYSRYIIVNAEKTKVLFGDCEKEILNNLSDGSAIDSYKHDILGKTTNTFSTKDLDKTITFAYDTQKQSTSISIDENGISSEPFFVQGGMGMLYYTHDNDHYVLEDHSNNARHIINIATKTAIPFYYPSRHESFHRRISPFISVDNKFLIKNPDKSIQLCKIIPDIKKVKLSELLAAIAQKNKI